MTIPLSDVAYFLGIYMRGLRFPRRGSISAVRLTDLIPCIVGLRKKEPKSDRKKIVACGCSIFVTKSNTTVVNRFRPCYFDFAIQTIK
jgi:hypothetical protein